jgi:hypothetical protein
LNRCAVEQLNPVAIERLNGCAVETVEPVAVERWHIYPEQAAAGLWTTPSDLARFAIELQRVASGRSGQAMSPRLAREMLTRQYEDWGLGVGVSGDGRAARFSHGGANEGFRCFLVGYRDTASGVAIMTNSDSGGAILQDVVRAVAREYGFPGIAPVERTLGTADPAAFKDFAGRYEIGTRSPPVVIRIDTDGVRLYRAGNPRSELLPENDITFFALDSDLRIRFERDASGRVSGARVWQGDTERRAVRADR